MNALRTAAVLALLVGGALGSAQTAIFEEPNAAAVATFYRGQPAAGGQPLETVRVNNSPIAMNHPGIAGHTFVTLEYGGDRYTVPTFPGGTDKFTVLLNPTGAREGDAGYDEAHDQATSLADLLDQLATDETALERLGG